MALLGVKSTETEQKQENQLGDYCNNPVGYNDGSSHSGSSGNDEPWLNPGYILKLNGTELANGLDVAYKEKRWYKNDGSMKLYLID